MKKTFEELRAAYEEAQHNYFEEMFTGGENERYWFSMMNDIIEEMFERYNDETSAYIYG